MSDAPEAATLEIVERVPVVECVRRGTAIDLILSRGINKRSQFVFTTFRGRSMIFWQTPKAAGSARPGVRVPYARATGTTSIVVDTREKYGYRFAARDVEIARRALSAGDYAVVQGNAVVAVVERKTLEDFTKCLVDGSLAFALGELATLPNAVVVIEGSYSALLRNTFTSTGFLADLVARLGVSYPSVPLLFLESRKLAEEWTFRYLRAAAATARAAAAGVILLPGDA